MASFDGAIEVRDSPGAGRGLFATRAIEENEIVLVEKAFCVALSHEADTFSALTCDVRDDAAIRVFPAGLHRAVMQKLVNNPSQVEKVLSLHSCYEGIGTKLITCDGTPIIDVFQVHDIIQRNAFGLGQQNNDEDISNASTGLWIRASLINHSCVPNTTKGFIGDVIVIRAARRIDAGEEITLVYDESSDYEARTAALQRTWGFRCNCKLCVAEEADGMDVRKRRRELENQANTFVQRERASGAGRVAKSRAQRLFRALNETFDDARYQGLPRRALWQVEAWLRATSLK